LKAHGEVFGEALDTAPFAGVLTVKALWIKLIAQTQCLVLFVQAGQICLGGSGEVEPFWPSGFILQLMRVKISAGRAMIE